MIGRHARLWHFEVAVIINAYGLSVLTCIIRGRFILEAVELALQHRDLLLETENHSILLADIGSGSVDMILFFGRLHLVSCL
jgi:hypothetical protein